MQALFEKVHIDNNKSIQISEISEPFFPSPWHFHPEIEIMYVKQSAGTRIVGNNLNSFREGDLVIVGSGLPHVWRNDDLYYQSSQCLLSKAIVIKFRKDFLGENFFQLPEMKKINRFLERSQFGIWFKGEEKREMIDIIKMMPQKDGVEAIVDLIVLLNKMSITENIEILSKNFTLMDKDLGDNERMDKIISFILEKFKSGIKLCEVA